MSGIVPEMNRPQPAAVQARPSVDWRLVRAVAQELVSALLFVGGLTLAVVTAFVMVSQVVGLFVLAGSLALLGVLLGLGR